MKTLTVTLLLSLTAMMALPATLPRVHAVLSNGNNYWSAYGPSENQLLYKVYNDFTAMFTDFNTGGIDITDWPVQPGDLGNFIGNPDFFVTTGQGEFGIDQVDYNHQDPFLGVAWQTARTTGTPSLTITNTVVNQPAGSFQLIVNLKNLEEGGATITDVNNLVTATISGQTLATATASGPSGTYTLSVLSSVPASYSIATTIYSGAVTMFTSGTTQPVCPATNTCTATLSVNYNSGSTLKPSTAGIAMARAIAHLVNKPQFLTGSYLTTAAGVTVAKCLDVQAPSAQNLMGSISTATDACEAEGVGVAHSSSVDLATLNAECGDANIAALITLFGTTCAPSALYLLHSSPVVGAASCTQASIGATCFPSQSAFTYPGYASSLDLAAACVYFMEAGFTTTGAGTGTIAQQCQNVANGVGHLNNNGLTALIYIRTDPKRKPYGTEIADSINYLYGSVTVSGTTVTNTGGTMNYGINTSPSYWTIGQIASIVFSVATVADWNIYTGAFTLGSTPDHLYSLYSSQFASNLCGPGKSSTFPNNYPIWCDPAFDTQANAGENVAGVTFPGFQQAAILGATRGMTNAIFSGINQFVGLNAWSDQPVSPGLGSSLVSIQGHGFEAATGYLLNMQPVPGYVPTNPLFYASGCNTSTGAGCTAQGQALIRRSMAQATTHMNPYTATTAWEFEPLIQIYDSMLAVDPNSAGLCQTQPGGSAHCVDWMTTSHSTSFDGTTGLSTQTWNLRGDIFFHDGVAVTAHDVCFSILSDKQAPSANSLPSVANVVSCTAVTNRVVSVVLTGNSPFNELNIGGLFILPEHVWAPICGGLTAGTDACVTPANLAATTLDPVAAGDMVGSGPWVCNTSVGVSTIAGQASCTQNADGSAGGQALAGGARILLNRNVAYMRCCANAPTPEHGIATTNLQALEWSDSNKDGKVNILDIASAAAAFGTTDPYFANPIYAATTSGTVDIGDIATIASYFDDGLTAPFLGTPTTAHTATPPAGLTQVNPQTDPYRIDLGSGNFLYYQGVTVSGSSVTLRTDPCATCTWSLFLETGGTTVLSWDSGDPLGTHLPVAACQNLPISGPGSVCTTYPGGNADIEIFNGPGNLKYGQEAIGAAN
jgi:hypothetical protein